MNQLTSLKPINYLMIGHVTADIQRDKSIKLGGTASFSGLTAHQLGHQVGVITSCGQDLDLSALDELQILNQNQTVSTSFENISTPEGRIQFCYSQALLLTSSDIPSLWRQAPIVHLGPIISEISADLFDFFPDSLICLTPQGMLRSIDQDGKVSFSDWSEKETLLPKAHAVVLSFEDLQSDERLIEEFAGLCKLLVVTENREGARVYWKNDVRNFKAPQRDLVDDTGAGDIFAACFFHRLYATRDPWEAARFAVELAANSVTRRYTESMPTPTEIELAKIQII